MPTRSSLGTRPGADFARICSSTPGAILQPHPPPWLNWVSRTCMSIESLPFPIPYVEILPPGLRERARHEFAQGAALARRREERPAVPASRDEARQVAPLLQRLYEATCQSGCIANIQVAGKFRARHADVARDAGRDDRRPRPHRLDAHVGAAL